MKVRDHSDLCGHYAGMFTAYLDRSLPAGVERELAEHLEGCPVCQNRLEGMRALVERLAQLGQVEAGPEVVWMVKRAIAREERRSRARGVLLPVPFLVSAAAAAALLVVVSLPSSRGPAPSPSVMNSTLEAGAIQQPLENFVLPPRLGSGLQAAAASATASGMDTIRTPAFRIPAIPVRFRF
ncbi:anti-sigma factor family protein [Gemmatimonadota bacterium]